MNDRTFSVSEAHRLDDPERPGWLPPHEVVGSLDLKPGLIVADIGAGTGYFSFPIARGVGTAGRVYAVDFQTGMLDFLGKKLLEPGAPSNITPVHGSAAHSTLSGSSADLVFMANLWHEIDDPGLVLTETSRILRHGGRLVVLDWRTDLAPPPGPPAHHRVAAAAVAATLESNGWLTERSGHVGKFSYLIVAKRRA